jgi:hypothetical protein
MNSYFRRGNFIAVSAAYAKGGGFLSAVAVRKSFFKGSDLG